MQIIVATRDYAGLGFATRLKDEGHGVILGYHMEPEALADPACSRAYELVGQGMVDKVPLPQLMEQRESYRDWLWVWDFNHHVAENETLRREGFKVFGGGEFADRMEHDRQACLDFVSTYGLQPPPSFAFTSYAEAIRFCEQNPGTAYVYKPDEGANFETFLPVSEEPAEANEELRVHLGSLEGNCSFILQELKEGVETNVEVWFQNGLPVFAWMGLEVKHKHVMDLGQLVGCSLDFTFVIPLDCLAVKESVGKLFPAYRTMRYTGFADANFIAARDGIWFLEKCERFGYNAHPNLLFNLSRQGLGELLASFVEGTLQPSFAGGFGASVTMFTKEEPTGGKAIQFPERLRKDLYIWDAYSENGNYRTAGFERDGSVLLVMGYGYTLPTAWESVMKKAATVKFPYRTYRPDGDGVNYPSSPLRRYEALKGMGYI